MGWKTSGGGSGSIAVPSDLEFSGANLAACQTARDAFFTANPARKSDKVRVLLKPTGAAIVLQQWDAGVTTWRDQTAVVRGPIGLTGPVGTKASLGLDLVDNTTDAGKPISTATQGALDLKADKTELTLKADIDDVDAALLLKLNISDAATLFAGKQDKLTSGTNLKTVNGESLLGAGNIALAGGSGMTADQIAQLSRLNSLTYAPVDVVWTSGTISNAGNDITGTAPNIVDGVTLAVGMRVLHATGGLDGIYEVTSISGSLMEGSWTRAADMRAGSTFTAGAQVVVRRGTRNAGRTWTVSRSTATGVVGTNLSTWEPNVTVSGLSNPTPGQVFKATTGPNGAWGDLTAAEVGALAAALRGAANGVASLEADGKLKLSELPDSIVAGLKWQGTWNAATNVPAIPAAAVGNNGFFYRVATAGNSSVTGSAVNYIIGDWLISNGNAWQRVENTLDLVNDLSTGGTGKALAAAQGPAIKALIDAKPDLATAAAVAAGTAAVGVSTKAAREDHVHPAQDVPALATANPLAAGTAAVGVSLKTAREDHVHPAQTIPAIVNDLTTGGATATLSAEQGKILAGRAVAPDWALANTYAKNALVRYTDDLLYMANATIPTTTAWAVGTTGATWRAIGSTQSSTALDVGTYKQTAQQSIPDNVDTKITGFTALNTSAQWQAANHRFLISKPGTYLVRGRVSWIASSAGSRQAFVRKNGTTVATGASAPHSAGVVTCEMHETLVLASGDFIELFGWQNSGAALNTAVTATGHFAALEIVQLPTATIVAPNTITATNTPTAGQMPKAVSGTEVTWVDPTSVGTQLATAAPLASKSTAEVGTGTKAARDDHVHRHPDSLHNGTRKVANFSTGDYTLESITVNKTIITLNDTSYSVKVNNVPRFSADADWTIMRGPLGVDATSYKFHMSNNEAVIHGKGALVRVGAYDASTVLRSPAGTNAGGTHINLTDTDVKIQRKDVDVFWADADVVRISSQNATKSKIELTDLAVSIACNNDWRFGANADVAWAHSPSLLSRTWLRNDNFEVNIANSTAFLVDATNTTSWNHFIPDASNTYELGRSDRRWSTVFGVNSNFSSDERLKRDIAELPDALLDAWGLHVSPKSYVFKQGSGKTVAGFIAQDIIAAFDAAGLDWRDWVIVTDGEHYGVDYNAAQAIENAHQRRRLDRLEAQIQR